MQTFDGIDKFALDSCELVVFALDGINTFVFDEIDVYTVCVFDGTVWFLSSIRNVSIFNEIFGDCLLLIDIFVLDELDLHFRNYIIITIMFTI